MPMPTWAAVIRIHLRNLVENKTKLLEQLRHFDTPPKAITFDRYEGKATFHVEAQSQVEAYQRAAQLVERFQKEVNPIGVTVDEFDVSPVTSERRPLSSFRVAFVHGSWVEVTADHYEQYGRGHPWIFRDDRKIVVATFPEHLVGAIVSSEAFKDSSDQDANDAVEDADDTDSDGS